MTRAQCTFTDRLRVYLHKDLRSCRIGRCRENDLVSVSSEQGLNLVSIESGMVMHIYRKRLRFANMEERAL